MTGIVKRGGRVKLGIDEKGMEKTTPRGIRNELRGSER